MCRWFNCMWGDITLCTLTSQAPSLLITLINMFLGFGKSPQVSDVPEKAPENEYSVFGPTIALATVQVK